MRFCSYTQAGTNYLGEPKQNQDSSLCGEFPYGEEEKGYFLVVSDGIGSKSHSHLGSHALCLAVKEVLHKAEADLSQGEHGAFLRAVHRAWLKKLGSRSGNQCSCTALIAVVTGEQVFLFRLGDGFLAGVWRGETHILMEDKAKEGKFLNETEGLQEDFLLGLWECHCFPRTGFRGILACTDGIDVGEGTLFDYDNFSRDFLKNLFPQEQFQEDLEKIVAQQENRDDKTMALLLEEIDTWKQQLFQEKTIYDIYGKAQVCETLISQGGQGVVYRTAEPNIAVKIVFDKLGEKDCIHLEENQKFQEIRCLPAPSHVTLPRVILEDYVGYTMELLEDMESFEACFSLSQESYEGGDWFLDQHLALESFVRSLHNYKRTGGLRRRLLAYYKLSTIFLQLHSRGLVFGDFSPKNVFFSSHMDFSHVWLIDVDNLDYESQHQKKRGYYTPRFVAPEVAKKERGCSAYSDDYSFALALFLQLTGTHPFAVESEEDVSLLTLEDFADNLSLNQRDRGEIPWLLEEEQGTAIPYDFILTPRLLQLFHRSFSTTGKEKRMTRASSMEWQDALSRALDTSITCPKCGLDYHHQGYGNICPWCDMTVPLLQVESYLEEDTSPEPRPLWTFVQERGGTIALPFRLLQGEKQEDTFVLGYAQEQGEEFLLQKLHHQFQFEVIDHGGRWGKKHRNFALKGTEFQLICRGKERSYRLEVRLL